MSTLTAETPAKRLSMDAIVQLFHAARTHNGWHDRAVPKALLQELYDLARMGPTSANASPARFIFLTTPEAKARLLPAMSPPNVEKTKTAPVTVERKARAAWGANGRRHWSRVR